MNEELKKSLTDLIDETLLELEELKKSRFAAAEVEIKGPGEELAGKPTNGSLDAKKADEDEDEDKEEDKKEEAEKAEGVNDKAEKAEYAEKADGINCEAEKAEKADKDEDKKDEPHKEDPEHEKKEKKLAEKLVEMHKEEKPEKKEVRKSDTEMESLMKSFVDERVKPLEDKLSSVLDLVKKIADAPVSAKGVSYKAVPLMKSEEASEPLSKAQVASKLFELKKSGSRVDSADIARAEMGHDLESIVQKYKIS